MVSETDFAAAIEDGLRHKQVPITVSYSLDGWSERTADGFNDLAGAIDFAQYEFEQSNGFGWADVYVGESHEWRIG